MTERLRQVDPRLMLAVGVLAFVGMTVLGISPLDAVVAVFVAAVATVEPTLADVFTILIGEYLPELAFLGLDSVVTTADAVAQQYGPAAGIGVGAVTISVLEAGSRLK